MQLNHYNSKFKAKEFPIVLLTDHVVRPANVGGLFRIADAFGVQKLILGGTLELNRKVWNTSRATEKAIDATAVLESVISRPTSTYPSLRNCSNAGPSSSLCS